MIKQLSCELKVEERVNETNSTNGFYLVVIDSEGRKFDLTTLKLGKKRIF